jgi:eukaryotic-like serine/threonine-protein kinase
MDSTRWERIQSLFHDATSLPVADQRAFLTAACGNDDALAAEVLAMLKEDECSNSVLDQGIANVANQMLGQVDPSVLPLKQFGPYRAAKVLGEGGMGVVYLAEREDLGSQVAIKVLRDAWLSPARRERFASEQRMLAQLTHPSIARLYDANALPDGTPWFVMEYVEGVPLTDYCQKYACPVERVLQLFRQVCEAVQFAHSHAVIHRDLKPSNIFVKDDGSVRLLDFGIAKQLESFDAIVDQTRTGLRLMTPAYAAPEQVRGGQVGIHTDVYSLGVVLYELLAGRLPFDLSNLTPIEAAAIILEHEAGGPSSSASTASISKSAWADLDVLCLTAMHKDPKRRYRSVEALIRDIDHYLKGEPLEARPDSLRYKLRKFAKRNERAVSVAGMVLVLIVGVVIFFTIRLAKARDAALAEAARTQRIQIFVTNLFQGGDEAAGPADTLRVSALLDRGVQEAHSLSRDPRLQAELFQTLGSIYQKLGKLDQADSLLRSALEQRKPIFGQDSPEVAESMVALGLLRDAQAQYEQAEKFVRLGLEIEKRKLPAHHPGVARATAALGRILEDRGIYDQAIPVLEEAVRLQSESRDNEADLARTISELANSHFYVGHYDISDSLNRRVLAIQQRLYGDRHPLVADTLINLGAIQLELGHYPEAEKFDRQSVDILQAWYGKDHPETASAMTILARTLVSEKQYAEAEGLLKQAVAIQEHVYGTVHPRVASALNELGRVAQSQGKLDEAEQDFRRMADIYRSVYGEHHELLAVALSNLGSVYLEKKQYARAEQIFRDVVQRFTEAVSANHLNTGIARIKLGRALLHQHSYQEAEVESRSGYEILFQQASPSMTWLKNARADLAEEYNELKQPQKAAEFRAELAKLDDHATGGAKAK